MKKLFTLILAGALGLLPAGAQNFFHRLDLNSGNLYTFAVSNLVAAGLNKATHDRLFDTSFNYTIYDYDAPGTKLKDYNRVGVTIRDLFADSSFGTKLGYQSFNLGTVNWGLYGSVHYRINQFKIRERETDTRNNMQRLQVGAGAMISFGSMESGSMVIVEAGVRYNIPVYYHVGGMDGNLTSLMDKGLSSYYALRTSGLGPFKGLGVFVEVPHYNLLKTPGARLKPYTFGLTYTIMPWDMDH